MTKKTPANVSVSGNATTSSSQPQAMGLANAGTTQAGKKRKSEPQEDSTPTQNVEQALLPPKKKIKASIEPSPPPPKKKMKASIETSKPSATTTATARNHDAPSKTKVLEKSAKKRPTSDESDDASVNANLAHPVKKAKVDKQTAAPIRRSGKYSESHKKRCLLTIFLETMIFQVGSKVVTHKPGDDGDSDVEEVEGENFSLNKTPHQQGVKKSKPASNTSEGPYETPVILRKKPWALPVVQVDDTEVEDSEIERVVKTKRKKATRVSAGDNRDLVD